MTSPVPAPVAAKPAAGAYRAEPNIVIRIAWFLVIGWWLSGLVSGLAWLLNVTIVGLPLGMMLLNRIPQSATLKMSGYTVDDDGAKTFADQRPWWQRALYFVFVGWWFSGLWFGLAWLANITIIGLPLGFWMYGAGGKVTTLKR